MKGHVVPKALGGGSRVWQRADVDNGFGSFFEAEAADAVRFGLDGKPFDAIENVDTEALQKVRRRFKFSLWPEGANRPLAATVRKVGDQPGFFVDSDDLTRVMSSPSAPDVMQGTVSVELDARSSMLITSLRSTHLAWFRMCGYRYTFSPGGLLLAEILRSVYREFIKPISGPNKKNRGSLISEEVKEMVDAYCRPFANLARPLNPPAIKLWPKELQQGTPQSGWFLALRDSGNVYGVVSVIKLGAQYVSVMMPSVLDARSWAFLDLAANLELEFSVGRFDPRKGAIELSPRTSTVIWPSTDGATKNLPAISISRAAKIVAQSGRVQW